MPLPKGLGLSRTMPLNPERVLLVMEHPGRGTRRYAYFEHTLLPMLPPLLLVHLDPHFMLPLP